MTAHLAHVYGFQISHGFDDLTQTEAFYGSSLPLQTLTPVQLEENCVLLARLSSNQTHPLLRFSKYF